MSERSFDRRWTSAVAAELAAVPPDPAPVIREADLASLPDPVRRYVIASGAIGRPVPRTMRLEADARMRRAPGDAGFAAAVEQVSVLGRPARMFLMRTRMFGLPVRALHLYRGDEATFQVRVAGLVTMVDESGEVISRGETVTVLNDLCVFAPGGLVDPRLAWEAIDDRTAGVTFRNGRWAVAATLRFNERDELVDFWSDDRPEHVDGAFQPRRWRTPLSDYADFDGVRLASRGLAVYERPDGPFAYIEFTLRSIAFDIA